jgi:DNA polymerase-3 subunit gamma/tau
MALYRTYRPARLDDVVGQDHVTGPLRRALENDRVHHAYLFSGPRGCGKTSTARILARSLNCEQGPTPDPCGVCQSCTDLSPNGPGSLDVIELDAASHGGVEDTRDLRERAMFAPASSRYKVYIIDEAHMVTTQGFNALLKLVEEPPPHVRFIFATTEADKVLPTIRSRTHNYTFRLVPSKTLQQHLAFVCESEGVAAEPAALALVARAGAGSVRDSLSVLGQVISGSGPEGVTYLEAVAQLGMTDATLLDETVDALADHDGAALFSVIDKVIEAGHDPRRFVTDLLERVRDLIVLHNVPNAAELGLIDAPEDQLAREIAQSQRFGLAELTRAADVASSALSELRGATAPRLHLELMAARLLLPASDADEAATRARLDQLERRMASAPVHAAPATPAAPAGTAPASSVPAAPEPTEAVAPSTDSAVPPPPRKLSEVAPSTAKSAPSTASTPGSAAPAAAPTGTVRSKPPARSAAAEPAAPGPAPAPVAPDSSSTVGLDQFVSMWPAVLEALKGYSRVAWMSFSSSVPISVSNGELAVGLADAGSVKGVKASRHDERLRQAVIDVMKTDVRVDIVLAPDRTMPAPRPAAADPSTAAAPAEVAEATAVAEPDAPSLDDPDVDDATGVDLALRELGATQIGEIEH